MRHFLTLILLLIATSCFGWGSNAPSMFIAQSSEPLPSGILFLSDDFERSDGTNLGSNWTEAIGDCRIFDGVVTGVNTSTNNVAVMTVNPSIMNGYIITSVSTLGSTQAQPGVIFRYVNPTNYSVVYYKPWLGTLNYIKYVDGIEVASASVSVTLSTTPTELRVFFEGGTISIDIGNDSTVDKTATDPSPVSGNIGLLVKEGTTISGRVHSWAGYTL